MINSDNSHQISCPLCFSENTKFRFKKWIGDEFTKNTKIIKTDAGDFYNCVDCDFVFKDLDSLSINLDEYYANLTDDYYDSLQENRRVLEHNKMLGIINQNKLNGNVLDIGCGTGGFLDSLDSKQWEKWGIDPALFTGKILKEKNIKPINTGFLNAELPKKYFDVVTMFDVMEHIYEPKKYIKKIKEILKDDGIILLATPNVSSLMAKISGKHWRHYSAIGHITFYSPKILKQILEEEGFSDTYISTYDYSHSFIKAQKNLIRRSSLFFSKLLILSISKLIFRLTRFNILEYLPRFNSIIELPWYYDFFCIKAIKKS